MALGVASAAAVHGAAVLRLSTADADDESQLPPAGLPHPRPANSSPTRTLGGLLYTGIDRGPRRRAGRMAGWQAFVLKLKLGSLMFRSLCITHDLKCKSDDVVKQMNMLLK